MLASVQTWEGDAVVTFDTSPAGRYSSQGSGEVAPVQYGWSVDADDFDVGFLLYAFEAAAPPSAISETSFFAATAFLATLPVLLTPCGFSLSVQLKGNDPSLGK